MSVVTLDARSVAADRLGCFGNTRAEMPKLYPARGFAIGFAGTEEAGLIMLEWFDNGALLSEWPQAVQDSDDAAHLMIVGKNKAWSCGSIPVFTPILDPFWAIGSGAQVAMGAMAMGAGAKRAIEITIGLDISCGGGIDVYSRKDLSTEDIKVDRNA